jgi:hypothetical protein
MIVPVARHQLWEIKRTGEDGFAFFVISCDQLAIINATNSKVGVEWK